MSVVLKSEMHTMQSAVTGLIYGPLWLSKGERFRPSGSYAFLKSRYNEYLIKLKKRRQEYREVVFVIRTLHKNKESSARQRDSSLEKTDDDEPKIRETSSIKNKKIMSLNTREITEYRAVNESVLYANRRVSSFRRWISKSKRFANKWSFTPKR